MDLPPFPGKPLRANVRSPPSPPYSGFEFWNFTYVMPANSSATPSIRFTIELDS